VRRAKLFDQSPLRFPEIADDGLQDLAHISQIFSQVCIVFDRR